MRVRSVTVADLSIICLWFAFVSVIVISICIRSGGGRGGAIRKVMQALALPRGCVRDAKGAPSDSIDNFFCGKNRYLTKSTSELAHPILFLCIDQGGFSILLLK